jgi:hypothetical protein
LDVLALLAAGVARAVAIFGVQGWRWDWIREVRELVFALDADTAGQQQWRTLARQAALRGKQVAVLPPEAYGRHNDVNEAWGAGTLAVGAWSTPAKEPGARLAVSVNLHEVLGGARRHHARRRSPSAQRRRTSCMGGAPRVPAVRDVLPRWT